MEEELYLLGSEEEMTVSTMMIVEGTENKRPGVLCEVEGPFIVLDKTNNNDRWYTNSLIDNRILGIPYTKKMLENRTLYGEASHPSDRFDVKLPLISHNITDLWYNDDKSILMGRADVLDTPSGRIIYTLIQYGSKIGISVRARGRLVNKGGKKVPDEDVYQFKTFDFVPNPGFDEARMSRVDESVEDEDLTKSFMNYVNEASVSELSCIQSIFESANDEIFGDIKNVIKARMSENTLTRKEGNSSVTEMLYEETVKNEEKLLEFEERVENLQDELDAASKAKENLQEEVSTLKLEVEQKTKDIEDITSRLVSLFESESIHKSEAEKLTSRVELLTGKLKQYRSQSLEATQQLEESEQLVATLEKKCARTLQKLDEAQDMVASFEVQEVVVDSKVETSKKINKVLPQGKSQVLNESVVDTPTVTDRTETTDTRRRSFIQKCSF